MVDRSFFSVKKHYKNHLKNFYSWIVGDFNEGVQFFNDFLNKQGLANVKGKVALDLGAGNGIQSVALAKSGYKVNSVDFCSELLLENKELKNSLSINLIESNIVDYVKGIHKVDLILCWGDTLTHLPSEDAINEFLLYCSKQLAQNGKIILSFRDYSNVLQDDDRFILVKSDGSKVLTCFLEYEPKRLKVTDIFYENQEGNWKQTISHYYKTRLSLDNCKTMLGNVGISIDSEFINNGMITIIGKK